MISASGGASGSEESSSSGARRGDHRAVARKTDRTAEITIVEREKYPQYSRCGLPYGISGIIPELTNLIEAPEERLRKNRINIMLDSSVTSVDVQTKIAHVHTPDKKLELHYDSLILATGARASIPPIKGIHKEGKPGELKQGIFVLRTIDDARGIQSLGSKGKRAVVVGGGLVGLEVAERSWSGCK
jgi:NADH oxidase (H2O2-forming)